MKTNKTIIGFIGAAAIGASLGILFAPDKGTNTRKKIAKKTSKTKGDIKDKLDQLKKSLSDQYDNVLQNGEKMIENSQSKVDNIKQINKEKIV